MKKKSKLRVFHNNNSGIILLVALWTLVILVILAVTLGRNARVELALTKNSLAKFKSYYLAQAGIMLAKEQLRFDSDSDDYKSKDNLIFFGFAPEERQTPESIYKDVKLGEGSFTVSHVYQESEDEDRAIFYGMIDEESKININAISLVSVDVLINLIKHLGFDEGAAMAVSYSVVDWIDPDIVPSHSDWGAEEDYYDELNPSYMPKNLPFDSIEELKFVRGVDEELYKALKDHVTIYPKKGQALKVNFETARSEVLNALTKSASGAKTNTEEADAESLVEKMLSFRRGEDGLLGTEDDAQISQPDMQLNSKERVILLSINPYRTKKSNYFRIQSKGVTESVNVTSRIEAVISREELEFLDWQYE